MSNPVGTSLINPENTRLAVIKGSDNKEYAIVQRGTRYYVRNMTNQDVIPEGYKEIIYDNNGFILVDEQGNQGYYFMNAQRISPKYRKVEYVPGSNFLRVTTAADKVGYINTAGDEYFKE